MEAFKENNPTEHFLDLETQVSTVRTINPDGTETLLVKDGKGNKIAEITFDQHTHEPISVKTFSGENQERVFTDPKVLAEADRQVRGLLGEVVEEEHHGQSGAIAEGRPMSADELKTKMLDEEFQTREFLKSPQNPGKNPKGH